MALVSYGFGFFCAVLLLLYYIVPGRFQWRILLAASVLFYGFAGWVLPLGISYYTFQSMGYLIDVYQRKYDPEKSLLRTALFVFYFPQLTVGPISRFDRLKEEL